MSWNITIVLIYPWITFDKSIFGLICKSSSNNLQHIQGGDGEEVDRNDLVAKRTHRCVYFQIFREINFQKSHLSDNFCFICEEVLANKRFFFAGSDTRAILFSLRMRNCPRNFRYSHAHGRLAEHYEGLVSVCLDPFFNLKLE